MERNTEASGKKSIFDVSNAVIYALIAVFSVYLLVTTYCTAPIIVGECDDYMLGTIAVGNHFDTCVRPDDLKEACEVFPTFKDHLTHCYYHNGLSPLTDTKGNPAIWYFGTYSFFCAIVKKILSITPIPPVYTFMLANTLAYIMALGVVARFLKTSQTRKLFLVLLLMASPVLGLIIWSSAEVFMFSVLVCSLVCWHNRSYKLAAILLSIVGTLNATVMALGFVMIADYCWQLRKRFLEGEDRKKIMKDFLLYCSCYVISIVPFFYNGIFLEHFVLSIPSLFVSPHWPWKDTIDNTYFGRLWAYFFDLNFGFLPYYLILLPMFLVSCVRAVFQKDKRILLYFFGLLGVVMAFSLMFHVNCGMSGISRYGAWAATIFIFGTILDPNLTFGWIKKSLLVLAVICQTGILIGYGSFKMTGKKPYIDMMPLANAVLNHAPWLYNPLPCTFVSRTWHVNGGYFSHYGNDVIALHKDKSQNITKILYTEESTEKLKELLVGNEEAMSFIDSEIEKNRNYGAVHYINIPRKMKVMDRRSWVKSAHCIYPVEKKDGRKWQWMDRKVELLVENAGDAITYDIDVTLSAPAAAGSHVTLRIGDSATTYAFANGKAHIHQTITLPHGQSTLVLTTDAPRVDAPNDDRALYMMVENGTVSDFLPKLYSKDLLR